jgi:predicted unusual protein kinase regulating ubiquinone biosynthesis (AarF/ABC1/UbiB family)
VPAIVPELSTKRLICMEYCPGVKISDTAELEKQGFDQVHLLYYMHMHISHNVLMGTLCDL